ncbi:MAG TPA: aminoacyl-tRNA hydrolase [Clostridiales bacterium]|nr:aminoacyl-tRNA hydrolase [Clostridia bacterium]HCS72621.1 aminoacyl-tRNA hydrolase [Clostridiales bacterium]
MYLIAGLGNPGYRYHGTRHNIGFHVLDLLAEAHGIRVDRIKHKAVLGEGRIGCQKLVLAKPQTFMNNSGESLLALKQWYKPEPRHIILIYDDVDLEPGVMRIRPEGSAGTHNGMRSVIYHLQDQDFPRVRIGIGQPPDGWELVDYVLSRFRDEEAEAVKDACARAVKGIECILSHDVEQAMSRYNG